MATLTIRNVPDQVVERIKLIANGKKYSMEQEVRELLESRYTDRAKVLDKIKRRWGYLPKVSAKETENWRQTGRL